MMTLKAAHFSASKPRSSVARIRWPVDETGRNSVTPSTMPRMIAIRRIGTKLAVRRETGAAPREAIAAVHPEPFGCDRSKGRGLDSERFEALRAGRGHVVLLKHQPLVTAQRGAGQEAEIGNQGSHRVRNLNEVRVATGG